MTGNSNDITVHGYPTLHHPQGSHWVYCGWCGDPTHWSWIYFPYDLRCNECGAKTRIEAPPRPRPEVDA